MTTNSYRVTGMTCQHCVRAVTAEVSRIPGVDVLEVGLDPGRLTIESVSTLDIETLRAAVEEAGYELTAD